MNTYWLMGEDETRRSKRLKRGWAKVERSASIRRRNRTGDISPNPFSTFRPDASPQQPHPSPGSCINGDESLSQSFRNAHHLHPFSLLVGPTSNDLIRRSSSRRRRMNLQKPKEDNDANKTNGECDLEPLEFTSDTLPTIIRSNPEPEEEDPAGEVGNIISLEGEEQDLTDDIKSNNNSKDCSNNFNIDASTTFETNNIMLSEKVSNLKSSLDIPEMETDLEATHSYSRSESSDSALFRSIPPSKAPLVRIESLEFDASLDLPNKKSPKYCIASNTNSSSSTSKHCAGHEDSKIYSSQLPNLCDQSIDQPQNVHYFPDVRVQTSSQDQHISSAGCSNHNTNSSTTSSTTPSNHSTRISTSSTSHSDCFDVKPCDTSISIDVDNNMTVVHNLGNDNEIDNDRVSPPSKHLVNKFQAGECSIRCNQKVGYHKQNGEITYDFAGQVDTRINMNPESTPLLSDIDHEHVRLFEEEDDYNVV